MTPVHTLIINDIVERLGALILAKRTDDPVAFLAHLTALERRLAYARAELRKRTILTDDPDDDDDL